MWRLSAARRARSRSREAMAAISHRSPSCIPGMTFLRAMFAAPSTPQRTFVDAFGLDMSRVSHSRNPKRMYVGLCVCYAEPVKLYDIDPGPDSPELVRAIIEIPKNSSNKYEYDGK